MKQLQNFSNTTSSSIVGGFLWPVVTTSVNRSGARHTSTATKLFLCQLMTSKNEHDQYRTLKEFFGRFFSVTPQQQACYDKIMRREHERNQK